MGHSPPIVYLVYILLSAVEYWNNNTFFLFLVKLVKTKSVFNSETKYLTKYLEEIKGILWS